MNKVYKVIEEFASDALINKEEYIKMYAESVNDPDSFWKKHAKRLNWIKSFSTVKDVSFEKSNLYIKWFADGTLNVAANCIDRHLKNKSDKVALLWQGDDPNEVKKITYLELYKEVSLMANVLLKHNVKKGDRVTIYLTMIPELAYMMLACARIGAIHSIIFGGFSAESISGRILDCKSALPNLLLENKFLSKTISGNTYSYLSL